jgi:hypothetical protein
VGVYPPLKLLLFGWRKITAGSHASAYGIALPCVQLFVGRYTSNFTGQTHFRGSSEKLHVVERFTRTDKDTILYQFTVEDPATWAKPWSGELVMGPAIGPIYEFACHEGNYGLPDILSGARVEEKTEADEATTSQPR